MNFSTNELHYLINLVNHDYKLLTEMAADDPKNFQKECDRSRAVLVKLVGGEE